MRVALFTDTYLPEINGVVTSIEMVRKKLEELGHEVYVICTCPGFLQVQFQNRIIRIPGIELKRLYGYIMVQPMHLFLQKELKELHFDVIHCHSEFGVGIYGTHVAKRLHIPLVRTYHTTWEDYTHYANIIHSRHLDVELKKAVSYLSRMYGNDCMRLIAPSPKTKELLLSYGITTPIDVIPTGVELKRYRKEPSDRMKKEVAEAYENDKQEKIFLYVGRLAQEKSIDMLIKAFVKVKDAGLPARLVIIGDGPQKRDLQYLCLRNNVEDRAQFLGAIENRDIPAYYHQADCFLSASTSETQGMTYIEALASSLPVMGRRDEVIMDLIREGENGFFFDDEEELFEKIKEFLAMDETKIQEMKKTASVSVEQYDADVFAQKILEVYRKAIEAYNK